MASSVGQVVVLLVNTLGGLIVLALLLRFLLQATRADFYNPVTQSLIKLTTPLLKPLGRLVPSFRNFDIAALLLTLIISTLASALMIFSSGFVLPGIGILLSWAFLGMVSLLIKIYFWGLLATIIASWVAPHSGNPALILVQQLLEPMQSMFRKVIPPMGGLDFSPIFLFLAIRVAEMMIVDTFRQGLGLSQQAAQYVIGI